MAAVRTPLIIEQQPDRVLMPKAAIVRVGGRGCGSQVGERRALVG